MCTGGRSNESNNSYGLMPSPAPPPPPPPQYLQYTRELPSDLTEEQLIKEAEKVIAQTERIKCTVDTPSSLAGIRLQEKIAEGKSNKIPNLPTQNKLLFEIFYLLFETKRS